MNIKTRQSWQYRVDIELLLIASALLIIVANFLPYLYFGENAKITILDNLDSNIVAAKIILNSGGVIFDPSAPVDQVFNGIPGAYVYPTSDIPLLLFKIFGTYWGYVVSKFTMSLIGFFGMYLLLKKHLVVHPFHPIIIIGIATIYGLLPFWSFAATVSGLPFALFAFLNLRNKQIELYNWLILAVFAFYSSMILSGIFLLITLGFLFVVDTIRDKRINVFFLLGLVFLGVLYCFSHYPLLYSVIFQRNDLSHRIEMVDPSIGLKHALALSFSIFHKGQYHAASLHKYLFIPILAISIFLFRKEKLYAYLVGFILITSVFYGFRDYVYFKPIADRINHLVPIQFERFHYLHPLLWYILFAISLNVICKRFKYGKYVAMGLIFFQIGFVLTHHEIIASQANPSFKDFYAADTFDKIKKIINKPVNSYRVINVGLYPTISQYNGLYTLDGYFPNYPLRYKHQFRKVIEREIARDSDLERYFDDWGSRCYAFSAELSSDYLNNRPQAINQLLFNYQQLRSMGCEYILSSAAINLSNTPQLTLVNTVRGGYWIIYIYQIKDF